MIKKTDKKNLVEDTPAATTINPPEHGAGFGGGDDSRSRFEKIASIIGQTVGMSDTHLTKWYEEMMAWHDRAGHGVGVDNNSETNKSSINAHPSDAQGSPTDHGPKMGQEVVKSANIGEEFKQAVAEIFAEQEGLSEDFKTKASVLFETAVNAQVALKTTEIQKSYDEKVEGEVEGIAEKLSEAVGSYLDYTATKWLDENEVAIESSLRNEIMAEFTEGLRNLFIEHNFNIPEESVEVVETLAQKVEELEGQLNDAILENATLREFKESADREAVITKLSEGLTMVEAEKFATLVESVEAEDLTTFQKKAEIVKESTFVKAGKKVSLNEQMEDVDPNILDEQAKAEGQKTDNPEMQRYVDRIRTELALRQ